MSKALYRKYRPTSLNTVIGQKSVTQSLKTAIKQKKINHAYLFTGPRGCGKTSVARIFAHEINGFDYQLEDSYVDIIEIDAASNRGIDNIRELREKATIAPTIGKYKVYIIDEVHMLTKEAFNALLKLLEEPPAHVVFIMATTDPQKLPVTITSRAQTYVFKFADNDTMNKHLRYIADSEKINITDDAVAIITRRGGGSFRDSISLLDQISTLSDQKITADTVIKALGLPHEEAVQNLLSAYQSANLSQITEQLKDLLNTSIKPEILVADLISRILEKPDVNLLPLLSRLPEVQPPFAEAKLLVALTSNLPTTLTKQEIKIIEKAETVVSPTSSTSPITSNNSHPKSQASRVATPASTLSWESFLNSLSNSAIHTFLQKCQHHLDATTLHIYPDKSFTNHILNSTNNKTLLTQSAQGYKIEIHEHTDTPPHSDTDSSSSPQLQQISDIMGNIQEVNTDAEDIPF